MAKKKKRSLNLMRAAIQIDGMSPAKPPGRGSPQFVLRYSPEMRDKIARSAKANGRSINSELIALLERALSHGDDVEQLQTSMGEIFDRFEKLESRFQDITAIALSFAASAALLVSLALPRISNSCQMNNAACTIATPTKQAVKIHSLSV
jgi:predicted HicB family RNase H-like nuclease